MQLIKECIKIFSISSFIVCNTQCMLSRFTQFKAIQESKISSQTLQFAVLSKGLSHSTNAFLPQKLNSTFSLHSQENINQNRFKIIGFLKDSSPFCVKRAFSDQKDTSEKIKKLLENLLDFMEEKKLGSYDYKEYSNLFVQAVQKNPKKIYDVPDIFLEHCDRKLVAETISNAFPYCEPYKLNNIIGDSFELGEKATNIIAKKAAKNIDSIISNDGTCIFHESLKKIAENCDREHVNLLVEGLNTENITKVRWGALRIIIEKCDQKHLNLLTTILNKENINKISKDIVVTIIEKCDQKSANYLATCINQENITDIDSWVINRLVDKCDQKHVNILAKAMNPEKMAKTNELVPINIADKCDSEYVNYLAKAINEKNINQVNNDALIQILKKCNLEHGNNLVKLLQKTK